MSVAKIIEISADSKKSFDDAIEEGLKVAGKSVEGIRSAWVEDQEVIVDNGKIDTYRVKLKITFTFRG